jgi:transposase
VSILAELVDHVIGIDPDKETFSAAIVDSLTRGDLGGQRFTTRAAGYDSVIEWADTHTSAERRAWAVEGSGTYGKGLARALQHAGEWVIEFSFPDGPAAPTGAKTDHLDALRAGREVLGRLSWAEPRNADGHAAAIGAVAGLRELLVTQRTQLVNHLKALVLRAPNDLRDQLRDLTNTKLFATCAKLRPSNDDTLLLDELANTKLALRVAARQIRELNAAIKALYDRLDAQTMLKAPHLRAQTGVGPTIAAAVLRAWSHAGRIHSEAAFAALAGVNPIPVDSGRNQNKHRLNRSGDRQLNRALYLVTLTLARIDPETQQFIAKQHAKGRTTRHARRCLKRTLARRYFRLLENPPTTP